MTHRGWKNQSRLQGYDLLPGLRSISDEFQDKNLRGLRYHCVGLGCPALTPRDQEHETNMQIKWDMTFWTHPLVSHRFPVPVMIHGSKASFNKAFVLKGLPFGMSAGTGRFKTV